MQGHTALRAYRQAQKLSAAEFAKQLGIAEATLRSFENGTRPITAERAKEIEEVTGGRLTRRKLLPELFGPVAPKSAKTEAAA
jgi:transcriptional regulator with XRE-family HTH domain